MLVIWIMSVKGRGIWLRCIVATEEYHTELKKNEFHACCVNQDLSHN